MDCLIFKNFSVVFYNFQCRDLMNILSNLFLNILRFFKIFIVIQQMSGSKNYGIFTQWNSTQQKEGAYTLCNSMDGSGENYAKWNKPGGERQIP